MPTGLPGIQSVTIVDGSLGLVPTNTTGISTKVGACSLGVPNQIYSFTSVQDVQSTLGTGKLVSAISDALDISGGPIYAVKTSTSVAGTFSAVQYQLQTTPVASDGVLALTGSVPLDDYIGIVKCSRSGKVGTSPYPTFTYSLDNGLTFSAEIVIPIGGVYVIPKTGVTLTFTSGANGMFTNDTWYFTTTAATWNNSDVSTAFTALLADSRTWGFAHLVGVCDTTIATTVAAFMASAQTNERYVHTIVEVRDMNMIATLASTANTFPMTFTGGETLRIDISNDFGASYPTSTTFTFTATTYANIAALVAALNVQSFTKGLFTVTAVSNTLVLSTLSIKGQIALKVNAASTAIGGGFIQYTANQTGQGELEDAWIAALITAWTPFVSDRVAVFAGTADIYSSAPGSYDIRPGSWLMSGREGLVPIQEDLGYVGRGPLPFILPPDVTNGRYGVYHDEQSKPGLDAARFCTLRSFHGLPGFYITNGRTMATPGSDFTYIQNRRVIDQTATLLDIVAKQFINMQVRVNSDGTIFPIDAGGIEDKCSTFLYAGLKDNVVSITVKVDRTINVLSTQTLKITCSILPFGYTKYINLVVGFTPIITT